MNKKLRNYKKLIAIVNPISGTFDSDIEKDLKNNLAHHKGFSIYKTKNKARTQKYLQDVVDENTLIISCGGDGTIQEIAEISVKKNADLYILPTGTANVLANELGIKPDKDLNIQALTSQNFETKKIDVGYVNEELFLVRTCFGVLADMVVESSAEMKSLIGNSAYAINFIKNYPQETTTYMLDLDGQQIQYEASSLFVANSGHMGIANLSYFNKIKIDDGYLNIILIKALNLQTLIKVLSREIIEEDIPEIKLIKFKQGTITTVPQQTVIRDDIKVNSNKYNFKVEKQKLSILLPIYS